MDEALLDLADEANFSALYNLYIEALETPAGSPERLQAVELLKAWFDGTTPEDMGMALMVSMHFLTAAFMGKMCFAEALGEDCDHDVDHAPDGEQSA